MRWWGALAVLAACSNDPSDEGGGDAPVERDPPVETDPYVKIEPIFGDWDKDRLEEGDKLGYFYHVPENPIGLVWGFHGTNGSAKSLQQEEWVVFFNQLAQRGIGHVLTQSIDREDGIWSSDGSPSNPDWQRVERIFDVLVADGVVPADIPQAAVGFSRGTQMNATWATLADLDGWDVRALVSHNGLGTRSITYLPVFYVAAENDTAGGNEAAMRPVAQDCGRPCKFRLGREIPLDPRRFLRLGVTEERSTSLFEELEMLEFIDKDGERIVDLGTTSESQEEVFDSWQQQSRTNVSLALTQLRVVWATHRFSSEHATAEADFLLDVLSE